MTPDISLIIPVYNVEKFLKKALESVENQTFKNFETIIIDDGSTDLSYNIAEEFCQRNHNFKLLKQENMGPAAARNLGISVSKGNYITFMDSDDFIEKTFLEKLYNSAKKNDADIVCCNFNIYYPKKEMKIYMPFYTIPGTYTNSKALCKLILDIGMRSFVWNKIYKRDLFFKNNIKFENMYFEDISVSTKLFYYANKVVVISESLYNYTSRGNSILHTIDAIKINDYIKALGIIINFLKQKDDYKKYSNYLWIYSKKTKFIVYGYIFNLHMKSNNFSDFNKNISFGVKSINYFTSNKFMLNNKDNIKNLYLVKNPTKKLYNNYKK